MPAYMIAFVEIHDRERFAKEYAPPIPATLAPFGGVVLAVSDEAKTLEGTALPGRTVLIQFPDLESAEKWYASDAYAPLIALRKTIATTSIVLFPGGRTVRA